MRLCYGYQRLRILAFKISSDASSFVGDPIIYQPVLFSGKGKITIGDRVKFGISGAPSFYNGYILINSRNGDSSIEIKDDCWVSNNSALISEGGGIRIGKGTLVGNNVEIYDSDFHNLAPSMRMSGKPEIGKVDIGENVFIGSHVIILKGVSVGRNSVVGAGSVVTGAIPEDCIAGGNPCKVIRRLEAP